MPTKLHHPRRCNELGVNGAVEGLVEKASKNFRGTRKRHVLRQRCTYNTTGSKSEQCCHRSKVYSLSRQQQPHTLPCESCFRPPAPAHSHRRTSTAKSRIPVVGAWVWRVAGIVQQAVLHRDVLLPVRSVGGAKKRFHFVLQPEEAPLIQQRHSGRCGHNFGAGRHVELCGVHSWRGVDRA